MLLNGDVSHEKNTPSFGTILQTIILMGKLTRNLIRILFAKPLLRSLHLSAMLLPVTLTLECYHCGGSYNHSCRFFNPEEVKFKAACPEGFHGCRKGWINQALPGEEPVIRSCTPVAEGMCLSQNAGGSCTCYTDYCNGVSRADSPVGFYVAIVAGWLLLRRLSNRSVQ